MVGVRIALRGKVKALAGGGLLASDHHGCDRRCVRSNAAEARGHEQMVHAALSGDPYRRGRVEARYRLAALLAGQGRLLPAFFKPGTFV
jgi:hypothetical protein